MEQSPGERKTLISPSSELTGEEQRRNTASTATGYAVLLQIAILVLFAVNADHPGLSSAPQLLFTSTLAQFCIYGVLRRWFGAAAWPYLKAILIFWALVAIVVFVLCILVVAMFGGMMKHGFC